MRLARLTRPAVVLAFFLLHAAGTLAAQAQVALRLSLDSAVTRESLTNDRGDWREESVGVRIDRGPQQVGYVNGRHTERFGLNDREIGAGLVLRPDATLTLVLDATSSDTHRVLAKDSLGAQISSAIGGGWVIGGGLKRSRYGGSNAMLSNLTVERYVGSWRIGYTAYLSRATATPHSSSHRLGLSYYFSDDLSVALSSARGNELENTPGHGLRTAAITNVSGSAMWRVTPDFSLTLDAGQQRQGDFYTRRGVRAGARLGF